jgi:hypothetical protein
VWLQNQLGKNHHGFEGFGASYLWPPTGSYATHVSGCQKGNAKSNKKQGLTAKGVREADWGYPNQPFTRVPEDLIGRVRVAGDGAAPTRKWLGFCLVGLTPRKGANMAGRRYLHGKTYEEAVVDLNADMQKCLWWTFAAGAMMELERWYEFDASSGEEGEDLDGWSQAVQALYTSAHYAPPRGSRSAERSAASGAQRSQSAERSAASCPTRSHRQQRKSRLIVRFRLDWDFCEAWV